MSAKVINGIVISNMNYSDNSSIVKIISENRIITFLAQGTNKPLSKNRTSLFLFTYGEYEIFLARLNNKISKLKKGNIFKQINFDLFSNIFKEIEEILYYLKFATNSTKKFFNHFKTFIENVTKYNYFLAKTFLLFQMLELFGYKQTTDKCLECYSNKNLKYFAIHKGGFVCWIHSKKNEIKPINELKTFYYLGFDITIYLQFADPSANLNIYKEIKQFLNENLISKKI